MKAYQLNSFGRRGQAGYMLFGMVIVLAALASLTAIALKLVNRHHLQTRAEAEGQALSQFAIGLRGFAASIQGNPALIPGAPMVGVNWLKPPACGGIATNPAEGYVPCSFTGQSFGKAYTTSFSYTPATTALEIRTTFNIAQQGFVQSDAGLMADQLVNIALSQQSLPNNGAFYTAFANAPATGNAPQAGVDPAFYNPGVDEGRVVMIVSNAPSNDIFLRTDGTNQMLANLNMGGNSLANAKDGRFTGRVQIDQGMTVTSGTADLRGGVVTPDISLTSIGKAASQGVYDVRVLTGAVDYTIAKPDCTQAGNRPSIYTAMQGTGTVNPGTYNADALYEARIDVFDMGSSWRVVPVARGTKFDLAASGTDLVFTRNLVDVNPPDMRLVVMLRCK